jgi:uncharacterized protein YerC
MVLCGGCKYYTETGGPYTLSQIKEMSYQGAWHDFPIYVIPRLCAYYEIHPECFKPTGRGEEITVAGFASFIASDKCMAPQITDWRWFHIHGSQIIDPKGETVQFVEDLNRDGFIEACGQRVKVGQLVQIGKPQYSNKENRFGVCTSKIICCLEFEEYKYK